MAGLGEALGFDVDTPWRKLPAKARKAILEGCDEQVHVRYRNRYGRTRSYYADFEGVLAFLQRKMSQTESEQMKERYEGFMRDVPCPVCEGTRLKPEILAVTLAGRELGPKSIAEVCELSIAECADFLQRLTLGPREQAIAGQVLKEIQSRLGFLLDVGLEYLSLSRAAATLSGARRNASGWPPRSVPAWWGCCMCSTSRLSAYISATTVVSSKPSPACGIWATL
ncbi:uvrABC system A domain protein [Mycobacterium kansasii]|nr:uvrABC system A domain protein [Mycobacterium kansasii]